MKNNFTIESNNYKEIIVEIRREQAISPQISDDTILGYIKDGIYDINDICGKKQDFINNLVARSLLKNYVLYAFYKRLAEFKELYWSDYVRLQRDSYVDSNVQ